MPTDIENAARVARLKEEAEKAAQKNPEPDPAPEPGSDQDDLLY